MRSVSYLSEQLYRLLEERADQVAWDTGCVQRTRKFSGGSLLQMLVFGWHQHPDASLEQLASTAAVGDVLVTDTAVQKRFTPQAAKFLHAMLEEACSLVVQAAHDVPIALVRRFSAVILEDSSSISLPDELAEVWRGCGGNQSHTAAAVKLHVRWELKRGRLWGPKLSDGRSSDHRSPFNEEAVQAGSLLVRDLGYFDLEAFGPAPASEGVLADALACRDSALHARWAVAVRGSAAAAAGGADERDASAGGSQAAGADALDSCCGCPRRWGTSGGRICCAMRSGVGKRSARRGCGWRIGRS